MADLGLVPTCRRTQAGLRSVYDDSIQQQLDILYAFLSSDNMTVTLALRGILRRSGYALSNTSLGCVAQWRRYSTAVPPGTLPLEGIRVLDMTRVLAGVSFGKVRFFFSEIC